MVDICTPSKRSDVMRLVRSRGNKSTENRLIAIFRENKITGWRRNQKLLGKPDFVFLQQRTCIFVDGCFWHGCPRCYRRPASRQDYWDAKVLGNTARDRQVSKELKKSGWRVLRIWEHQLSNKARRRLLWRLSLYGIPDRMPTAQ